MFEDMRMTAEYEIWGAYSDEDSRFLEDCNTLTEAQVAVKDWRLNPDFLAEIRDKDTGEIIS